MRHEGVEVCWGASAGGLRVRVFAEGADVLEGSGAFFVRDELGDRPAGWATVFAEPHACLGEGCCVYVGDLVGVW